MHTTGSLDAVDQVSSRGVSTPPSAAAASSSATADGPNRHSQFSVPGELDDDVRFSFSLQNLGTEELQKRIAGRSTVPPATRRSNYIAATTKRGAEVEQSAAQREVVPNKKHNNNSGSSSDHVVAVRGSDEEKKTAKSNSTGSSNENKKTSGSKPDEDEEEIASYRGGPRQCMSLIPKCLVPLVDFFFAQMFPLEQDSVAADDEDESMENDDEGVAHRSVSDFRGFMRRLVLAVAIPYVSILIAFNCVWLVSTRGRVAAPDVVRLVAAVAEIVFAILLPYLYVRITKRAPMWLWMWFALIFCLGEFLVCVALPRYSMANTGQLLVAQVSVFAIGDPFRPVSLMLLVFVQSAVFFLASVQLYNVHAADLLLRRLQQQQQQQQQETNSSAPNASSSIFYTAGNISEHPDFPAGLFFTFYEAAKEWELIFVFVLSISALGFFQLIIRGHNVEFRDLVMRNLALSALGRRVAECVVTRWDVKSAQMLLSDHERLLEYLQDEHDAQNRKIESTTAQKQQQLLQQQQPDDGVRGSQALGPTSGNDSSNSTPGPRDRKEVADSGGSTVAGRAVFENAEEVRFSSRAQVADAVPAFLKEIVDTLCVGSRYVTTDDFRNAPRNVNNENDPPSLRSATGTCLRLEIANFCALSESVDESTFASLLCSLHTRLIQIVLDLNGTIIQCYGSTLVAVWGVPKGSESMEALACTCALQMLGFVQDEQAPLFAASKAWHGERELRVRIGINRGPCIFGNVGSESRQIFTAMGEAVVGAQILQELTQQHERCCMLVCRGTLHQARAAFAALGFGSFVFATREVMWRRWSNQDCRERGFQIIGILPARESMSDSLCSINVPLTRVLSAGPSRSRSPSESVSPMINTPMWSASGLQPESAQRGNGDAVGALACRGSQQRVNEQIRKNLGAAVSYLQQRFTLDDHSADVLRLFDQVQRVTRDADAVLLLDQIISALDPRDYDHLAYQGLDSEYFTKLRDEFLAQ